MNILTLIKLAWRNIWRNRTRSLVVIFATAIGLLAGVFASGFVNGLMSQKVESVIDLEISHFQFHNKNFREEYSGKFSIKNSDKITEDLQNNKDVVAFTSRVITNVMMASANHINGMKITGIDLETEPAISPIKEKMVEGEYLTGLKRNPIIVSTRTAEKYKLKLRSKVILTFQDMNGEMVSANFRVAGIFNTRNGMYDKSNAFVRKSDLAALMQMGENEVHEIVVRLNDHDLAEPTAAKYAKKYSDLEVLSWLDLATGMRTMIETMSYYTYILVGIIMVALIFSIINTMLMAVLDRTREIGMLMAVGMGKLKIFSMIMLESITLSMVGGPVGLLMSWGLISYFGSVGIDLSGSGGEMYEDMGFSAIVYPYLDGVTYGNITIMVLVMGVLAAIYPAIKALKLNPVEAIRKI